MATCPGNGAACNGEVTITPIATRKSGTIRLLLIEDLLIVRAGLRLLIESWSGMAVVGEASGESDALDLAERLKPDVILMKLDLHGKSSLDFLPNLISVAPKARVLLLTSITDPEEHWRGMRLGVMGVVLKEEPPDVLLEAIKRVHAGEVWFDPTMVVRLLGELRHPHQDDLPSPEAIRVASLTVREREVVALVCEGLRNKEISEQLCITDSTVRHHLGTVYHKLRVTNRLELAICAFKEGFAIVETNGRPSVTFVQSEAESRRSAQN